MPDPGTSSIASRKDIVVNGKFLRGHMTGVHRVAYEMCNALADLAAERSPQLAGRKLEVWRTRSGTVPSEGFRLPVKEVTPLDGNPWEQLTLPMRQKDSFLVNFCNIGPALSHNAITMIHDAQVYITPESYSFPFRLWYKIMLPILARRGRAVLTVSNYSRNEIFSAGIGKLEKIYSVYNGVDHILRYRSDRTIVSRLGLDGHTYAIALANTQPHKNIPVLLKAFSMSELSDMKLVLFGSADRRAFMAMGQHVPDNVIFAGPVSDTELRGLIEGAAAIAFPSRTEGFGLPPLEAMLLGTPAICAPCGALPEVCADGAIYADPDSPEAWTRALLSLAVPSSFRDSMVIRGQGRAAMFTWKRAAGRLLDIFDVIDGRLDKAVQTQDRV